MTDKLEDTSLRLKDEMDLYRKMMDKLKQNRHQFQKEKEAMQEVGGLLCNQARTHTHTQTKWIISLLSLAAIMLACTPTKYCISIIQHCSSVLSLISS